MKLRVLSASDQECVDIAECRAHLEAQTYGDTDVDTLDDAMITGWLQAAREHAEMFTGLSFVRRVYEGALDEFPAGAIELPWPLVEVTSITTGHATVSSSSDDTVLQELVDYIVDDFSEPPRLLPVNRWPVVTKATNGVRVRFVAGYGAESDCEPVPFAARAAILLVLGHLYATRETNTEKPLSDVPLGAEALLRPLRVRLGMA